MIEDSVLIAWLTASLLKSPLMRATRLCFHSHLAQLLLLEGYNPWARLIIALYDRRLCSHSLINCLFVEVYFYESSKLCFPSHLAQLLLIEGHNPSSTNFQIIFFWRMLLYFFYSSFVLPKSLLFFLKHIFAEYFIFPKVLLSRGIRTWIKKVYRTR